MFLVITTFVSRNYDFFLVITRNISRYYEKVSRYYEKNKFPTTTLNEPYRLSYKII